MGLVCKTTASQQRTVIIEKPQESGLNLLEQNSNLTKTKGHFKPRMITSDKDIVLKVILNLKE